MSDSIFNATGDLMPDSQVARAFNVSAKTVMRWADNPTLGFPGAVVINGALREFLLGLANRKGGAAPAAKKAAKKVRGRP